MPPHQILETSMHTGPANQCKGGLVLLQPCLQKPPEELQTLPPTDFPWVESGTNQHLFPKIYIHNKLSRTIVICVQGTTNTLESLSSHILENFCCYSKMPKSPLMKRPLPLSLRSVLLFFCLPRRWEVCSSLAC